METSILKKSKLESNNNNRFLYIKNFNTSFLFFDSSIFIDSKFIHYNHILINLLIDTNTKNIFYKINPLAQELMKLIDDNNNIILLSGGMDFYICVCKNGIFSWGSNDYGQLGIGNFNKQSSPQPISFFKDTEEILSLYCGDSFSICICKNGVFSWGANYAGQLGINRHNNYSSPQLIEFFKNPEDIIALSCGYSFCVCLCKNGLFSWGNNFWGQLGIGNEINQSSPQLILFFKNPEEIITFSCGRSFCVCLCKNGLFSWGENFWEQMKLGGKIKYQTYPRKIEFFKNPEEILSLSCGSNFCICVCKNGVFGWGDNHHGQLGIGNNEHQSSPQQIEFFKNPEDIISLSCGNYFCVCICENEIFNWGYNPNGSLGNKTIQCSPQLLFKGKNELMHNLSFPQSSVDPTKRIKKLLLILAREYLDPDEYLMGRYYLPRDMFKILLNFI
jgi:alpha-tubulin suppressor-like RCC1 family protein